MHEILKHEFPFWDGYKEHFKVKDFILPSKWVEDNFRLSAAYAAPGPVQLFPWEKVIVDAVIYFDILYLIAAVQTFKSMAAECIGAYYIDTSTMNQMWIYSKRDKIEEVFDERLKPMVQEVPAIRKYWDGKDDNLTKKRIKLKHMIARIASAGVKDDIATHNAGVILCDEFAKWPKKDFSQTKAVEGRKQASRMLGKATKTIYGTSPDNDQDPSYVETHKPGVIWFWPHYKCPHCNFWQYFVDSQVKEKPNKKGKKDHDTERIRIEKAAYYECISCKKEITEDERLEAWFHIKWLTKKKKIDFYDVIKDEKRPRKAVLQWNRLIDTTWKYVDCLIAFYSALNSPNPEDLKTYRNEDMAEWVQLIAKRFEDSFLMSKCGKYKQFGSDAYIPDGVSILLMAVDTQDNGFYFVARGYGKNLESWLIRADFIHCDMKEFSNPADVLERFNQEIYRYPYAKKDGKILPLLFILIDRGGHRSKDVDYIVDHSHNIGSYIGTSNKNAPLIEQKPSGHYFGMTERLSKIVQKNIESKIWHLPADIGKDYCEQVLNQYDEEFTDSRGNKRKKWICKDPDHFRDIENYLAGLVIMLDLQSQLFDDMNIAAIEDTIQKQQKEEKTTPEEVQEENIMSGFEKEMRGVGW